MKKTLALFLALAAAVPSVTLAQVVSSGAKAPEKAEETCPCSDYRFVAKTDKAKAVVEYWDARRSVKTAGVVGTFALMAAALSGRPTQTLNEAEQALGEANGKMFDARAKAAKLGGLKVEGSGPDAKTTITLQKGVDYTLDGQ